MRNKAPAVLAAAAAVALLLTGCHAGGGAKSGSELQRKILNPVSVSETVDRAGTEEPEEEKSAESGSSGKTNTGSQRK